MVQVLNRTATFLISSSMKNNIKHTNRLLAITLFVFMSIAGFAQITPNELISREKPAYSSNNDASRLVDNIFGYGVFTVSEDAWVAIEVGEGPSEVFITWNNSGYSWSDVIASETSCKQGTSIPVDYTIQISGNSTDGEDGDWTIVDSITDNTVTTRGHRVTFEGASWIKIVIDSGGGSFDEVEVFDMSDNGTDTWFFPGTSISANAFKSAPDSTFADDVTANHPGFTPLMIRGGIPCMNSTSFANDIDLYLENAGNVNYWAIEMGTNDAWGGSNYYVETFRENMEIVIEKCLENGITPIIARMIGTNEDSAGWQVHEDYLTAIDELTEEYGLIEGPDFFTWFSTHPNDLSSDGVHPSDSGNARMQKLWAEQMAEIYNTSVISVTGVTVTPETISVMVDHSESLSATIEPSDATNSSVSWISSDTSIVEVNASGKITGISEGEAIVSVITLDGSFTDSSIVTVVPDTVIDIYTLSVSVSGDGSVEISPNDTNFEENTVVTLTAVAEDSAQFLGWGGDISGDSTVVTITMVSDLSITASFSKVSMCDSYDTISLPFSVDGEGENCWIAYGDIDYVNSWGCDSILINGKDFTNAYATELPSKINDAYQIYFKATSAWAHFEIEGSSSDTSTTDSSVSYTLTTSVSGEGSISPSSGTYDEGSVVELTASAADGWQFSEWSGDASGTSTTASVTMDADKNVTATFVEIEDDSVYYTLTVSTSGEGSVEVTPSEESYLNGTTVSLIATPDSGYVFDSWSGDTSSTSASITITIDANKNITANFTDTSSTDCDFILPSATALPSINESYSYVYVIGSGPDLSNIANFTINWNLENEGLYQLSITTNDGNPDWWNDLLSLQANTFSETEPTITFTSTGFTELDGTYYVTLDGENFVMESEAGDYIIYFSNSATAPCSELKRASSEPFNSELSDVTIYPNPFTDELTIESNEDNLINTVQIFNTNGQVVYQQNNTTGTTETTINFSESSGIYLLRVIAGNNTIVKQISKK